MKLALALFLTSLLTAICNAQPAPDTLWTRTYGGSGTDAAMCIRPTMDGNYIMAGYTQSFGEDDLILVKINDFGDTLWTHVIDLENIEQANSVCATNDGGYALAGSILYMDGGNTKILLVKTNSGGDTLWTRTYGQSGTNQGYAVRQTPDGGYIIAGSTRSINGDDDVLLVKTNSIGDTLWTHVYEAARNDGAMSVERTANGGYVLAGYSTQLQQATSAFLLKVSETGNQDWRREYTGLYVDAGFACQSEDGGYMVAGTSVPGGTRHLGPYLMKTDNEGNMLWMRMHSVNPLDEWMNAALMTSDGGYILAGAYGNIDSAVFGMTIIRMDSLATVQWTRTYGAGTGAMATSIAESMDHSYLAAGVTETDASGYDIYTVRTGPEDLVIVYPNGGESVAIGRPLDIRWNGSIHGGSVVLQLNRDYPSAVWEYISTSATNNGRYTWIVDGVESDHVRFRIEHLTLPACSDTSDSDLSFRIPGIRLTWPNGGESILSGIRETVRFERVLVTDNLQLQINRDYPVGEWDPVVDNIPADSTAFWIVQLPGGIHCRLRLVSLSDSSLSDITDADFLIRAPQMTVISPNGGEQLAVGVAYTIMWAAPEHQGNIRITVNRDYPSGTWELIATSVANNGQRSWTPAPPASDRCRIRISTALDPQSYVESAADFAIIATPVDDRASEPITDFALDTPSPNPFNSRTMLSYSIPEQGNVTLVVYDLLGCAVQTITCGVVDRGKHQVLFNATGLPSGMYFYRLQWGGQSQIKKMLLLK